MNGWRKAREAAWAAFGMRFWAWFVVPSILARLLPALLVVAVLAGAGWTVWWLIDHEGSTPHVEAAVPAGEAWPWALVGVLAVAAVGAGLAWFARPAAGTRWLAVALAAAATVAAALILVR